jgi:hypothetical protein
LIKCTSLDRETLYTLVKENSHTKVKAIIEPIQVNQFIEQSEQSESAPKQFVNKPVIDKNEQPYSTLETFKLKRNQTLLCLQEYFNNNIDLKSLCFHLDIDWQTIKENSIDETAIEIIRYCERHYGKDSGCDHIIKAMKQMRHPCLIERYLI